MIEISERVEVPASPRAARGDVNKKVLLEMLAPMPETEVQVKASYAPAGYHYDQLLDCNLNSEDGSQLVEKYHQQLVTEVRETIVARKQERSGQLREQVVPYDLLKRFFAC